MWPSSPSPDRRSSTPGRGGQPTSCAPSPTSSASTRRCAPCCCGARAGRSAAERTMVAYERARLCFERWGAVDQLPQPVVAAIQGYCLGAGLELAMLADIRIAATDAIFALPQVTLGTQIVGGADLRMIGELGAARTKLLAMTGRRF